MPIAVIVVLILVVAAAVGYVSFAVPNDAIDQPIVEETNRAPEQELSEELVIDEEPDTDAPAAPALDNAPVEPSNDAELAVDDELLDPEVEVLPTEVSAEEVPATTYVDGTYSVTASYLTPRRVEHVVDLEFTIENDVVVAVNALYDGAAPETGHHTRFDNALAEEVVGVPLSALAPSRIGGASLTTAAFNEAVAEVRTEAASV